VGCYVWYSEEGRGLGGATVIVLLYNGTLLCDFNVAIKGLSRSLRSISLQSVLLHSTVLYCHLHFCRDILCKRGLSCHAVSEYSSVTFVNSVKTSNRIFKVFFTIGSHSSFFRTKRLGNIPIGTP